MCVCCVSMSVCLCVGGGSARLQLKRNPFYLSRQTVWMVNISLGSCSLYTHTHTQARLYTHLLSLSYICTAMHTLGFSVPPKPAVLQPCRRSHTHVRLKYGGSPRRQEVQHASEAGGESQTDISAELGRLCWLQTGYYGWGLAVQAGGVWTALT